MTEKQLELLKDCINAVRTAECRDHELVEVELKYSRRTAQKLIDLGLVVEDFPSWANEITHMHVRLIDGN
jgi:hypothetical protein